MFAHQVIEDIQKQHFGRKDFIVNAIKTAKKFHVGNTSNLGMATEILVRKSLFWDHAEYCRPPFDLCWFDYIADDPLTLLTSRRKITKRGILCAELDQGLIETVVFFCDQIHGWTMSPVQWIISIDRSLLGFKDKLRLMYGDDIPTDAELMNANVLRLPSFTRHGGLADFSTLMQEAESIPHVDQFTRDDSYEMLILQATLMLLNCRNVITVNHQAPERLNAKRCRNGKQALFPYRTIRIVVPRKRYLPSQAPKPGDSLSKSVHICRGHFKDYKENAPLFGKHAGMYWWQPQVRGVGSEPQSTDYKFVHKKRKAS